MVTIQTSTSHTSQNNQIKSHPTKDLKISKHCREEEHTCIVSLEKL